MHQVHTLQPVTYLATREMLANTRLQLGQTDAARTLLLNSHDPRNLLPPVSPGSKARSRESLARLYEKQRDIPAALQWLQQAESEYAAHPRYGS
ncbi:MAG: hypothetical protein R3E95_09140 [Thiolinea sp.]